MKEITQFSQWADKLLEDSSNQQARMGTPMKAMADRPLPRQIDVQYKAQRAYPELSPEQAFAKYLDDELENNEKVDNNQNKQIASINHEVDDVEKDEQSIKTDLAKVTHDEAQIHSEVARLIQLIQNKQ